jgi:hypothetical protein
MEILRFEEATTTAPKRKKSSKGFLTLGFVAALFSVGSAFATNSIAINGNAPIGLGQGVTLVTACDTAIGIAPITAMELAAGVPTFYMNELQINGIDVVATNAVSGLGCGGKTFDIQIFDASKVPYTCALLKQSATVAVSIGTAQTLNCVDDATDDKLSFVVATVVATDAVPAPVRDYTISFTKAPSDISYITVVTR